ncbi:MAG: TonB-dependent receptor [Acidobacteriota bacterium]
MLPRSPDPFALRRLARPLLLLALLLAAPTTIHADDATVRGQVENLDGAAVGQIEIVVDPPRIAPITVDADGRFAADLPPGRYRLTVLADGYEPLTRVVTTPVDASAAPLRFVLRPASSVLATIDVTGSYAIDRSEPVATVALTRDEIMRLPRFGDDLVRALAVVPGMASNDVSAQLNVRGGLYRDTAIRLDGLEIFEPYHLKDFQGVFSIVDPDMIDGVDLIAGGFPAEYGDKMAGVLDMTLLRPAADRRGELGISLASLWASGSGALGRDGDGRWLASGRRGYLDLLLQVAGDDDEEETEGDGPAYWDVVAKVDRALTPSQNIALKLLIADDSLDQEETETDDFGAPTREVIDSTYGNGYLWLDHQALFGARTFVDNHLSVGRVERDRFTNEEGFDAFTIRDVRDMDVYTARTAWNSQPSDRHYLKWGVEARRYDVRYDYTNDLAFDGLLGRNGLTRFVDDVTSESFGVYVADRIRLGERLVVELGARYDRHDLTDDDFVDPRVNGVFDAGRWGTLRASWGRYGQSQRPNELQVEDGEIDFLPAERATNLQLGWARSLGKYALRLDAYRRTVDDPRPYFTNLFEAFNPNPEATRDRVRVAPTSARAEGVELLISRRGLGRFDGWLSYAWSEVTDRIDGRDVARGHDQTHAVTLNLNARLGPKWNVNVAWHYHTGWPTTALSGRAVRGDDGLLTIEPVLGPRNGEHLDDYHRLDLRVARRVTRPSGNVLELFVDVQNLYNRDNQAGFSVDERNFTLLPSGDVQYTPTEETWLGILPSFGVSWRF